MNSTSNYHFDCLIIGGGPAGLTAALTLARQRHTAAVFDSGEYHNANTQHMYTVPTWDNQDPAAFRAATRKESLENYQTVTYIDRKVSLVRQNPQGSSKSQDCFELVTEDGATYHGAKLLLASGVKDIYPAIPGFAEAWPSGIFHCLFCHGYEERGAESCGVLAVGPIGGTAAGAMHSARSALQLAKRAVIYTNGDEAVAQAATELMGEAGARLAADARRIVRIEKLPAGAAVTLHFEDGSSATEAFLTHMPATEPRGNLVQSLGLEVEHGNVAAKSMFFETSVRGVFAAGDVATHHKIFNNAVWMGCAAGAGIALQLQADIWGHKPLVGH